MDPNTPSSTPPQVPMTSSWGKSRNPVEGLHHCMILIHRAVTTHSARFLTWLGMVSLVFLKLIKPSGFRAGFWMRGFPKIRGICFGFPIIRIVVLESLYWGFPYFGKLPSRPKLHTPGVRAWGTDFT